MIRSVRRLLRACGPCVLLPAAACGAEGVASAPSAGDSVYVGVAVGLQTPSRYVNVFNGVQLALDELNAARPAGSPPLALRRAPASATSAVEIAAAFRDDPAVIAVVGHTESDATVSAAAIYEDREGDGRRALAAIAPTAAAPGVTQSDWVFRVCPPVTRQAEVMAAYLADTLRASKVAVIYRNDGAGKGFLRGFIPTLHQARATVTERDPFVEEIPEFEAYGKRIARTQAQGVGFFGNATDVLALLREMHAAGSTATLIGANAPSDSMLMDPETKRHFAGTHFAALYVAERPVTDAGRRFAVSFRERFRGTPDHWGALGYDAAQLIGRAVHEAGADRKRVRDAVAQVGRGKPAFSGATGEIRFDEVGDPIHKPVMIVRMP